MSSEYALRRLFVEAIGLLVGWFGLLVGCWVLAIGWCHPKIKWKTRIVISWISKYDFPTI